MQIGQAKVDFDALKITGPAGDYSVEPKVMQVLSVLVDNAGEVVTREALIDQVWGVGYGGDERLSRAVSLLRKSLGETRGNHTYIQTIPKKGYKFVPEVQTAAPEMAQPQITDPALPAEKETKRNIWTLLIPAITAAFLALAAYINFNNNKVAKSAPPTPLVMIMDSAHPARIYDEAVRDEGGTNADILSDILSDLPIRTQKELISPSWDRYEAITRFDPDLIVIHYSGFKQEDGSGDRPQLRLLVDYFQKTDTEFLVYSRASQTWLDEKMDLVLQPLYGENPALKDRIDIFPLLEYGDPHWKDQGPAQGIKLRIKEKLELE